MLLISYTWNSSYIKRRFARVIKRHFAKIMRGRPVQPLVLPEVELPIQAQEHQLILDNLPATTNIPGVDYELDSCRCEHLVSLNGTSYSSSMGSGASGDVKVVALPKTLENFEKVFNPNHGSFGDFETTETVEVAVKIVPFADEVRKNILREYDALKAASGCLYAVKFIGAVFTSTAYFFIEAMHIDAFKYYQRVKSSKQMVKEEEVQCIAFSLLCALKFLCDKNIMHRDVKPSNVMLHNEGTVKLTDFSISRTLDRGLSNYTEVASQSYLPPERCRLHYELRNMEPPQNIEYDFKSDVWCFGVTLIEIAQMGHPYEENSNRACVEGSHMARNFDEQLYRKLNEQGPELKGTTWSSKLRKMVQDCVLPEPKRRPNYDSLLKYEFVNSGIDHSLHNLSVPFSCPEISQNIENFKRLQEKSFSDLT